MNATRGRARAALAGWALLLAAGCGGADEPAPEAQRANVVEAEGEGRAEGPAEATDPDADELGAGERAARDPGAGDPARREAEASDPGASGREPGGPQAPGAPAATAGAEARAGADGRVAVFYVGHSLQNWTVPEMVASLARSAGVPHDWSAEIGNGAPLKWLWERPETAEGDDPRQALPANAYDALVLTEAVPLEENVRWNDTDAYARRFLALARRGNPRCRAYLYETWHDRDTPRWRARLEEDRRVWAAIVDRVNAAQDGPEMRLIPAGRAMAALHDRVAAGEVPGIASLDAIFADDIHLNDQGWYFVALVQFATVFGRSPVGLTGRTVDRWGDTHDGPPAEAVPALQAIAWDVVRRDPRAGVSP